jgi:2-hydroxychromene-2-carboxylate isomerase
MVPLDRYITNSLWECLRNVARYWTGWRASWGGMVGARCGVSQPAGSRLAAAPVAAGQRFHSLPCCARFLLLALQPRGGSVGMKPNAKAVMEGRMPRRVDYYFSFQSPWAYIGHQAFRDVVARFDVEVNHKPVVLVDLFSETGGLPLLKRHPVRQRYRMVELQRWRDKRGLNFHLQPANWPFNARLADGVVIAAIERGLDPDPFLRRAFAAVWEEQLNLADPDTIVKIADQAGLPGQQLIERSGSDAINRAYEQNRQDAVTADVFGSPVYVLDGEVFWGQDRIELLADALKSGRRPYSSEVQGA